MDTAHVTLTAELNEADRWFARANKQVMATVTAWKDCGRCQGKGYAHFLGGDRAPGICFGCAGKGRVMADRNEKKRVAAECLVIERNRLRFAWVSYSKALKTNASNTHWSAKTIQETYSRTLKNIEEAAAALPR